MACLLLDDPEIDKTYLNVSKFTVFENHRKKVSFNIAVERSEPRLHFESTKIHFKTRLKRISIYKRERLIEIVDNQIK